MKPAPPENTASRETRTYGVMSPMVRIFGLCSLVFIPVSLVDPDPPLLYTVMALWALSGLVGIGAFAYFMLTNPSRLHDSRQIERMASLQRPVAEDAASSASTTMAAPAARR